MHGHARQDTTRQKARALGAAENTRAARVLSSKQGQMLLPSRDCRDRQGRRCRPSFSPSRGLRRYAYEVLRAKLAGAKGDSLAKAHLSYILVGQANRAVGHLGVALGSGSSWCHGGGILRFPLFLLSFCVQSLSSGRALKTGRVTP